jgi:phytoene/squalene synthetase
VFYLPQIIQLETMPQSPLQATLLYYSYRQLDSVKQKELMAIENFDYQLIKTCEEFSEPSVALKKAHWWHDEINNVYKNQASHPVAQQLQILVNKYDIDRSLFFSYIEGKIKLLNGQSFEDMTTLINHVNHYSSTLEKIKTMILTETSEIESYESTLQALASSSELVRRIYTLPTHCQRNIYSIPQNLCTPSSQTNYKQLLAYHNQEALDALKETAIRLGQHARQKPLHTSMQPLFIRNKLHIVILKGLYKRRYPMFKYIYKPTPLKLILASLDPHAL